MLVFYELNVDSTTRSPPVDMDCFICGSPLSVNPAPLHQKPYKCMRCGTVNVTDDAAMALPELRKEGGPTKVDAVSHAIRQLSDGAGGKPVQINFHDAKRWFRDSDVELKPPGAQARNLIVWLGTALPREPDPAAFHKVSVGELASIVGARFNHGSIKYLVSHLDNEGAATF